MMLRPVLVALALTACAPSPSVTSADVEARYAAAVQAYENDWSAFERTAEPGQAFSGNLAPLADFLRAAMRQRRNEEAKEAAAVYLATLPAYSMSLPQSDYVAIVGAAPPTSPAWARMPQDSIRRMGEMLPPSDARTFLESLSSQHPDRVVQGWALVRLAELERREGHMDAYQAAYVRLTEYDDIQDLRFPTRLLNPENKVAVGKLAPAWQLRELGGERVVSNDDLRGRYYLLDFWATWCPPCIVERANLTRAQERFGGDRFTIVSVSIDNRPEDAIAFRQRRWPMNWLNLYAPGSRFSPDEFDLGGEMAEAYEINWIGVPQLVLVSPDGHVVALRDQLDGPMLERTLSRYLGAPS